MERKRMTATERDAMMQLAVGCDIVEKARDMLGERVRGIRRARSRLGIAKWAMETLLNDFMQTMPTEQLIGYRNNLRARTYIIGVRSPGGNRRDDKGYGMWISFEELNQLLQGCHDHCLMCDYDRVGQRTCALRKAVDMIPNNVEDSPEGDCPYRGLL